LELEQALCCLKARERVAGVQGSAEGDVREVAFEQIV
jgi:hypothetical protein